MKKVLFCGGSHMGNARSTIESQFNSIDSDYYITAAPKNREWSKFGGRYFRDGSIVGKNGHSPGKLVNLSEYSQIIFVGQWIQPFQYVQGVNIASQALLNNVFHENCFVDLPSGAWNEPLSLFPDIALGKCTLIVDPLPYSDAMTKVPDLYIKMMYTRLANFCEKRTMRVIMPPSELLQDGKFLTKKKYSLNEPNDPYAHCNNDYWKIFFSSVSKDLIV